MTSLPAPWRIPLFIAERPRGNRSRARGDQHRGRCPPLIRGVSLQARRFPSGQRTASGRSEEHTSELQSRQYLVCRLLLEKKKSIRFEHSATRNGMNQEVK